MRTGVIDIGGTFLKSAVFENGVLTEVRESPSEACLGRDILMKNVIAALDQLRPFDRLGVSTAGQVNVRTGEIKAANPNIPDYTGTPIRSLLEQHFNVPVAVENDANAAAVGEAFYGAASALNDKSFLMLTYGTGIGCAIFQDGKLFYGSDYSAGEAGYIVTHAEKIKSPQFSAEGTYEFHASTSALIRSAMRFDETLTDGRRIMAELLRPEVRLIVDNWIKEVILGLTSLIYVMNPSLIIVGGGIMNVPYIIDRLQSELPQYLAAGHRQITVLPAQLGNRAGMIGAGFLAEKYFPSPGKTEGLP